MFESHTRAIPRHKGGALVEFGRQVILDEVEGGIVTRYAILEHPEEHGQAVEAVAHHQEVFEHPPHLVTGDRGVHSADTESKLTEAGVKQIAIPAWARSRRNGKQWNTRALGGEGIAGVRALKAELPAYDATMDGANAHTTGKRDGAVARAGYPGQQPPPYCSSQRRLKPINKTRQSSSTHFQTHLLHRASQAASAFRSATSTSSPCEMEPLRRLESTRLDTETMIVCKKERKCGTIQEEFKERWKRIPLC